MTERKPPGISTQDWVEIQIKQAELRGDFEGLPGAGKPLKLADAHDPDWWVKDLIRRENIETDALLPPSVQLRKEKAQIPDKVGAMRRESEVRDYLQDLNNRIRIQIRDTTGVVVPVGLVDEEQVLRDWAEAQPAREARRPADVPVEEAPRKKSFWQRLFS
ncbi:DUF1992 domain-containing protein [Kribbella italica]|uniref:DnaJ homologue subfamily C member 28 conserved domain-containing protein n=1 Tax=Kribbella italica TaxID=1540520 RepID=A0A7W9JEH4_9ACTN|nr:DUF1992 domain-containing protein [Kribbella italica]MBB5840265.1 hypothetical protein [Kribbella italica]